MSEKILVFIPMYNCAPQISRVLAQLQNPSFASLFDGVVCVDNRSIDSTVAEAVSAMEGLSIPHRAVLLNDDNYGLGGSHKAAISYSLKHNYDYLIVLHGDDQGSVSDLVPCIKAGLHRDLDCLLGSRFISGSVRQGYSLLRTVANVVFNVIFSVVAGHCIYDLGSGLNMYRTAIFADNFHVKYADDLTFNYYLILGGYQKKLRTRFFPLTWREDGQVSNAKLFRQGLSMIKLLLHRLISPKGFMAAEHRATPRLAYTSTVVREWGG